MILAERGSDVHHTSLRAELKRRARRPQRHRLLHGHVLPGLAHRTLAGAEHGLEHLAIWSQSIDPQGATPPHFHDCEEAIIVQRGEGTRVFRGEERRFRAGDATIVPPSAHHQIVNTGDGPLVLVTALRTANVVVTLPDGTPLDLPWK